jgi:hypothetical protein
MRPTVEEQLQGTCRVLENVVAPCVTDAYARTMLAGLIANLRMLSGAVAAVPGFLAGDNRSTAALLGQLQSGVAPDLAERIGVALAQPEPDATDMASLEQRNSQLRELLSQALCGSDLTPGMRAAALKHMSERAARAPMRYVPTAAPAAKPT